MSEDYEWQRNIAEKWAKRGHRGVLRAVPGAGKTKAGVNVIKSILQPGLPLKIVILAPTKEIIKQWEMALTDKSDGLSIQQLMENDFQIKSYFWGAKHYDEPADLVVYDECHSLLSEVRRKALDIPKKMYIGLSATPGESVSLLGGLLENIGWDEANIAPFDIEYVTFPLSGSELMKYKYLTNDVKRVMSDEERDIPQTERMMVIMKRRSFVYELPKRLDIALHLVKANKGQRIIIFAERLEQVENLSRVLATAGYPNAVYTSDRDTLERYKSKEVNILITSRMVKEGFNDPSTTLGILVSTPLSERNQVQTVGRIIRFYPEKTARIYIILAEGTTDMRLAKGGMPGSVSRFEDGLLVQTELPVEKKSEHKDSYYSGAIYGFRDKDIWRKRGYVREYAVRTEETNQLTQKMRSLKPLGGKFTINDKGVFIKVGEEFIKVADTVPEIVFVSEEEPKHMTWDELMESVKVD